MVLVSEAENLVHNGGFEGGTNDWRFWSRADGALSVSMDGSFPHSGKSALRLENNSDQDWSIEPALRLDTRPGDVVKLECWVQVQGAGSVSLCGSSWDPQGRVVDWSAAERTVWAAPGWQHLSTRILAGGNVTRVQPRLIGAGPILVRVDDYSVERGANVLSLQTANLPPILQLSNRLLSLSLDTSNATFSVADLRSGRVWEQLTRATRFVVKSAAAQPGRIECSLLDVVSGVELEAVAKLDPTRPEYTLELGGQGDCPSAIPFPAPFVGRPGDYLVVPMNEGISYPVDDPSIPPMRLIAYGGHGICMAFFGVTDGHAGQMAILETPDDASIRINRVGGLLAVCPEWDPQLGRFGYRRRVRYVFFKEGGHVAMAKRYRAYAQQIGLFKTLAEKCRDNPRVDRLIGAVNVWCWDRDGVGIVKEMQDAGIERILWSNQQSPANLRALNAKGVLTSRYDIYQDVMAPTNFPRLRWIHPDWTTNAWPQDIILDRRGNWLRGWGVESRDGTLVPCGVLCDRFGPDSARERVPTDLASHPYLCRFIDTTTAAPWNECYSPVHPMTRSDSRGWKMDLLRYISQDCQLVTGSETGHDAAVPFVDYFEGMLSLGPYRVPDAGRRMAEIWTNVPEPVARFQLGQRYRLPLWELVYHDCVVAQWYWGDYSNKLPALWDNRDLFNALYGTPPMFMFDRALWHADRDRFLRSYQRACPVVRKVGYQEMTDHRFLTSDRDVQQTRFADGVCITVNFGAADFTLPDGRIVPAKDLVVEGL